MTSTRREVLTAAATIGIGFTLGEGEAVAQELTPTPACGDADDPTPRQTEGPFFKPRSPQRNVLREPGMPGKLCTLSGRVLTRACAPVAGALVDIWHADDRGNYDNAGFRLRGHVFTDAEGRYGFRTVAPGAYPGRTSHFHVKVQAPARPVLTTQFYFPSDAKNARDPLFRRELLMKVAEVGGEMNARFDVVLDMR